MTTLTANQLALYLGCEIEYTNQRRQKVYTELKPHALEFPTVWPNLKPILRPTHSLNATDALKYLRVRHKGQPVDVIEVEHETRNRTRGFWYRYYMGKRWSKKTWLFHWDLCYDAITTLHLISEGFDVLNWIEQGLAIDKTQIQKPLRKNRQ
jgi:hypothetical protein